MWLSDGQHLACGVAGHQDLVSGLSFVHICHVMVSVLLLSFHMRQVSECVIYLFLHCYDQLTADTGVQNMGNSNAFEL